MNYLSLIVLSCATFFPLLHAMEDNENMLSITMSSKTSESDETLDTRSNPESFSISHSTSDENFLCEREYACEEIYITYVRKTLPESTTDKNVKKNLTTKFLPKLKMELRNKMDSIKYHHDSTKEELHNKLTKIFPKAFLTPYLENLSEKYVEGYADYLIEIYKAMVNPKYNLIIQSAIGGTTDSPNARLCSYASAGLRLLDILHAHNQNVRLRLASAHHFLIHLCDKDETVAAEIQKMNTLAMKMFQKFVNKFFPNLKNNIDYEVDSPHDFNLVRKLAQEWIDTSQTSFHPDFEKAIKHMNSNHGTSLNQSYYYAFAHVGLGELFFDGKPLVTFLNLDDGSVSDRQKENGLICIGGTPERFFDMGKENAKQFLKTNYSERSEFPSVARLISKSGSNTSTVYYKSEHDAPLREFVNQTLKNTNKKAMKDINMILQLLRHTAAEKDSKTDNNSKAPFDKELKTYQQEFLKPFIESHFEDLND